MMKMNFKQFDILHVCSSIVVGVCHSCTGVSSRWLCMPVMCVIISGNGMSLIHLCR